LGNKGLKAQIYKGMMVEKVTYTVLKTSNNLEIRKYSKLLLAVVEGFPDDAGFGYLFKYISGHNKSQKKIDMTAPVITSEKINMTAPVITQKNSMAFVMPPSYNKNTIPIPLDKTVIIKEQKERILAVIKFSGRATPKNVKKQIQNLLQVLQDHSIHTLGDPIVMRYNSPFTPGFLRRNEVAIEISYSLNSIT
jgi:hypothetical protein